MGTGGNGTEDCLYLNVYYYTASAPSSALLPVLFYMHGGGLMAGAGTDDMTPFLVHAGNGERWVWQLNLQRKQPHE